MRDRDEHHVLSRQEGIALLTVLLMLLLMSVLGIAAITVTGLENRMAGFFREGEAVVAAADACEGTSANIIQQTITNSGVVPLSYKDDAVPPGPVPAGNYATLNAEIMGFLLPPPASANTPSENFNDTATAAPNLILTNIPGINVRADIDRLYARQKAGTPTQEVVYRITCVASNAATGASSTVTSIYACTLNDTCIKKF